MTAARPRTLSEGDSEPGNCHSGDSVPSLRQGNSDTDIGGKQQSEETDYARHTQTPSTHPDGHSSKPKGTHRSKP